MMMFVVTGLTMMVLFLAFVGAIACFVASFFRWAIEEDGRSGKALLVLGLFLLWLFFTILAYLSYTGA